MIALHWFVCSIRSIVWHRPPWCQLFYLPHRACRCSHITWVLFLTKVPFVQVCVHTCTKVVFVQACVHTCTKIPFAQVCMHICTKGTYTYLYKGTLAQVCIHTCTKGTFVQVIQRETDHAHNEYLCFFQHA